MRDGCCANIKMLSSHHVVLKRGANSSFKIKATYISDS